MDYYKILVKKFHPDLNNNSRYCTAILKVINKSRGDEKALKNLYERMGT